MADALLTKTCLRCKTAKLLADFSKGTPRKFGVNPYCRECCSKASRLRLATLHGGLYGRWNGMIHRCENAAIQNYRNYGERGITVCAEWHDFGTFKAWALANGYKPELEIDRIDNDGPYSPDNCRWVTRQVNAGNKRCRSKSGYLGVYKKKCRWQAVVCVDGRGIKLGTYSTPEEAARARDAYAVPLGYRANFPESKETR